MLNIENLKWDHDQRYILLKCINIIAVTLTRVNIGCLFFLLSQIFHFFTFFVASQLLRIVATKIHLFRSYFDLRPTVVHGLCIKT
jgi:hypothetical protein